MYTVERHAVGDYAGRENLDALFASTDQMILDILVTAMKFLHL